MMPIIGRLRTRPDFLKVAAEGAKWVTPGLILQARRRPPPAIMGTGAAGTGKATARKPIEEDEVRVGFTVSRKVGNATKRNRARRRLRAAAAEVLPELGRPGCDYVLIGRVRTLDRRYGELVEDLRQALGRVGGKQGRGRRSESAGRRR
ncbi:MAG: ribonuclease P protein component [Proteobacteria bacterium]|nr:ribonuclease P protein component [Pseudomonadota bacterium]